MRRARYGRPKKGRCTAGPKIRKGIFKSKSGQLRQFFPFATPISDKETDGSADPVQNHGDPHADGSVSQGYADEITEPDPEEEHGGNGHHHGVTYVIAGPEHVGESKGERPQKAGASVVNADQRPRQLRRLRAQPVQAQDPIQTEKEDYVEKDRGNVRGEQELFGINANLLLIPGAHALSDYSDHGQVNGASDEDAHAVQIVGHAVGRDLYRPKTGNDADHQDASQLENAVFHAARNADGENSPDDHEVKTEGLLEKTEFQRGIAQEKIKKDTANCPGNQRGDRHPGGSHMEAEDTDGIARHIDQIDENGNLECNLRISHGAEKRRTGIVYGQKRKGEGGNGQIDQRVFHYIRFNATEKKTQQRPSG